MRRDFEFATKFGLPIPVVVAPIAGSRAQDKSRQIESGAPALATEVQGAYAEYGISVNSGAYSGLRTEDAIEKMAADAEADGFGKKGNDISPERLGNFPATVLGHADSNDLL